MLITIEGVYRDGKIELAEIPVDVGEGQAVIVTFLSASSIDLRDRGINETQAADLRSRLSTFAEDWDSTEMSIYDHYDQSKNNLQTR